MVSEKNSVYFNSAVSAPTIYNTTCTGVVQGISKYMESMSLLIILPIFMFLLNFFPDVKRGDHNN